MRGQLDLCAFAGCHILPISYGDMVFRQGKAMQRNILWGIRLRGMKWANVADASNSRFFSSKNLLGQDRSSKMKANIGLAAAIAAAWRIPFGVSNIHSNCCPSLSLPATCRTTSGDSTCSTVSTRITFTDANEPIMRFFG